MLLWKQIGRNLFYPFLCILLCLYFFLTTEAGLKNLVSICTSLLPGSFHIHNVEGNVIQGIKINELEWITKSHTLKIKKGILNIKLSSLFYSSLKVESFLINYAGVIWGPYALEINPSNIDNPQFEWKLTSAPGIPYELNLAGFFRSKSNMPLQLTGEIREGSFTGSFTEKWILSEASKITVNSSAVLLPCIKFTNPKKATATGSFNWKKDSGIEATLDIPLLPLSHSKMSGLASLTINIIKKPMELLKGTLDFYLNPGQVFIPVSNAREYKMPFQGGSLSATFEDKLLKSTFTFNTSSQNGIKGNLDFNTYQKEKSYLEQSITGNFKGKIQELNILYAFFPEISRLQSTITLLGTFSGTLKEPQCHLKAETIETAFSIPKYKVRIKKLKMSAEGNLDSDFTLMGSGKLGEGYFTLKGTVNPFSAISKNKLEISGKNLKISNTENAYVIANPKLTLQLEENIFYLQGEISIPEANIILQDNMAQIRTSNDVKLIGKKFEDEQPIPFKWVPNLYLKLENNVHFKGYGLEGIIGGKLKIEKRLDGLHSGLGRLTIKEGKYRLQGSTRYIHQGRLLFPPGTLLNDPILDIRISERPVTDLQTQHDLGIYVQGTLQKPIYQLYSTAPLQNNEILSKLGFVSETNKAQETNRLVSQTAYLLAGGANPLMEKLQSGFKLDEFGLTTRSSQKRLSTPGSADTALIVGKSLSKRLYLQYLQSIMEPNSTVRLKYFLSPRFTASIETSTEEDFGVDLIYSVEKD